MRATFCAIALLAMFAPAPFAQAQGADFQAQPNAVLQIQRAHILDGVWRMGIGGTLTLTTRADEVLEGEYRGRPCHGQYRGNAFSVLCSSEGRGAYVFSGWAVEEPPVATTARARVVAQPARMLGQVHQAMLNNRGHLEELNELRATRQ